MKVKNVEFKELASNVYTSRYGCNLTKVVKTTKPIEAKFKVVHDTGNCYSKTNVYIMTPTGEWTLVAGNNDIGNCYIDYVENESFKMAQMERIYKKVLEYIVSVWMS